MVTVGFEPIDGNEYMPTMATKGAAAYDLFCPIDVLVPHGRSKIPMRFKTQFPNIIQALIEARSGFELKGFEGYDQFGNCKRYDCDVLTGKVDSDYRGEVNVIVKNYDEPFLCKMGTRIAQMTFVNIEHPLFVIGKVNQTDRADGGFEHSGTREI